MNDFYGDFINSVFAKPDGRFVPSRHTRIKNKIRRRRAKLTRRRKHGN